MPRQVRVGEGPGERRRLERPVEDLDLVVVEVGGVQEMGIAVARERQALEDRAARGGCGTVSTAWFTGSMTGAQASMVPPSVAKMNRAAAVPAGPVTMKSFPPLNTIPVGAALPIGGMGTTSPCFTPAPL